MQASGVLRPSVLNISNDFTSIASIGRRNEKLCFLFQSDKNSGCYGNLYVPWTYNWKSGNLHIFSVSMGIFGFFLQKCLYLVVLYILDDFFL